MKILIIEDNAVIARQVGDFLIAKGWSIDFAATGELGIILALAEVHDVVLLDLNLPDMDGLVACTRIKREAAIVPAVLMLTARDAFEDKSEGFHTGADDYVTKPFDLRELALRCEALARRRELHQPKVLQVGSLCLNSTSKTVSREGRSLTLTHTAFVILQCLMQAHPQPVSRSELLHRIWGDEMPDSDALKSHIYSLRNTVDRPFNKALIKTVLNVGYKLDAE